MNVGESLVRMTLVYLTKKALHRLWAARRAETQRRRLVDEIECEIAKQEAAQQQLATT